MESPQTITVIARWQSTHTIEVPPGTNKLDFVSKINDGQGSIEEIWDHIDSSTAELVDWDAS